MDPNSIEHRYLEDSPPDISENGNDGEVLRDTFIVYGSAFIVLFLLFCFVRQQFPKVYQIRDWLLPIKTDIAKERYGFFSWIWELNGISEYEILEECGMDALSVLRLCLMGYKIAALSAFNAIWLMPLYSTAVNEDVDITDRVVRLTIANVSFGSKRLLGTVFAAYILFFYVMYLIYTEFKWFIAMRHKHLSKPCGQNYAVYVNNIPEEYRSNDKTRSYFRHCINKDAVSEARLLVKASALQKEVSKRQSIIYKLEHAVAKKNIYGSTPYHSDKLVGSGTKVESIPTYVKQLEESNDKVANLIQEIEEKISASNHQSEMSVSGSVESHVVYYDAEQPEGYGFLSERPEQVDDIDDDDIFYSKENDIMNGNTNGDMNDDMNGNFSETKDSSNNILTQGVGLLTSYTTSAAQNAVSKTLSAANTATNVATDLIPILQDGDYYPSGFVTFRTLRAANAALQMVHHETPFHIQVTKAPHPKDIFWFNVGRTHKDLQIGKLFSVSATTALCLFWTIPMAFIASLSSVEALSEKVPFIEDMIEAAPFVGTLLAVLAPLFVQIVNSILPYTLECISMLEGPVAGGIVISSAFTKLAAFQIIQTFFVSAVSSSILQEISNLIENPTSIIKILAVSLPSQSTYFIQIVFVGTVITGSFEILRVVPLAYSATRHFLPPRLTKAERQRIALGFIRPLAEPDDFESYDHLAQVMLNFIVMLVYAVISPLTVFIQGFCYLFLYICYKHQFVYIYPPFRDSGGKIWLNFIGILMSCMLIAEVTVVGLLALKGSVIATPLLIPLLVITVLFNVYIRQEHFRVAEFLPTTECMRIDLKRKNDKFDFSFLEKAYLQNEMRERFKLPTNLTEEEMRDIGILGRETKVDFDIKSEMSV